MSRLAPAMGALAVLSFTSSPVWAEHGGRHGPGGGFLGFGGSGHPNSQPNPGMSPRQMDLPQPLMIPAAPAVVRTQTEAGADNKVHMTPAERRQLREDVSNAGRNLYPAHSQ